MARYKYNGLLTVVKQPHILIGVSVARYNKYNGLLIIGWAGVRGGFNFRILLVMYFYSLMCGAYQLIVSDLLLEFYYNDYLFNYHIITYFIY